MMTRNDADKSESRPLAVVTGASSGIGLEYAERLAVLGYDLVIVARRRGRLQSVATQLEGDCGAKVEVIVADLTNSADLRKVEDRVRSSSRLEVLVNAAGFGTIGEFAGVSADRIESEIALNVTALVRLTRAAVPGMTDRKRGAIVNVSSMASFQPNPFFATYGASKAYVTSFTEALAAELGEHGVYLQALCPGPVRTEFGVVAGLTSDLFPSFAYSSPSQVVDASIRSMEKREVICVPGAVESLLVTVIDLLPRWFVRRASMGLTRRMLGERTSAPSFSEY
jgi:short-subunit dehydrogenase